MECFSHFLINGVFESLYKSTYSDPNFPQYFHLNRFQRILASSPTCIMHIFLLVSQSGSSVTQLHLALCDPHGLQHTRLPCPSPTPKGCSNSCPSSQWCHFILCCPLLLLPSVFPSIRVFSNALCIRWPTYWNFSFSISPSSEYSRLISFMIDWFDLLAVQGTLKSLLQPHSSSLSCVQMSEILMRNDNAPLGL